MKIPLLGSMTLAVAGLAALEASAEPIQCGETVRDYSTVGHVLILRYPFAATAGDVISFHVSMENGAWGAVSLPGMSVHSDEQEPWLCGWLTPETGTYTLWITGGSVECWLMSVTMYCGPPPEACPVAVVAKTWSLVKILYR